jgi:transposase
MRIFSFKIKIVTRKIVYQVHLMDEDREKLQKYIRQGKSSARSQTRGRILLMSDSGRSDSEIVEALGVSKSTVARIRMRYCQKGLEFALNEKPRSGAPQKIGGRVKAQIVMIACSKPPEGRSKWTMRLIAGKLVELGIVDSISHMSVQRELKKTNSSRGKGCSGA